MAIFVPGAQISSTIALHKIILSRNFYEGLRFWGSFVYFDVPSFEQPSQKIKFFFESSDYDLIKFNNARLLQNSGQYIN